MRDGERERERERERDGHIPSSLFFSVQQRVTLCLVAVILLASPAQWNARVIRITVIHPDGNDVQSPRHFSFSLSLSLSLSVMSGHGWLHRA